MFSKPRMDFSGSVPFRLQKSFIFHLRCFRFILLYSKSFKKSSASLMDRRMSRISD